MAVMLDRTRETEKQNGRPLLIARFEMDCRLNYALAKVAAGCFSGLNSSRNPAIKFWK
jgi:hypothetical protein